MTEPQDVCGAVNAESGLACSRPLGTNAYSEDRGVNVHVHWAQDSVTETVWRWEDPE